MADLLKKDTVEEVDDMDIDFGTDEDDILNSDIDMDFDFDLDLDAVDADNTDSKIEVPEQPEVKEETVLDEEDEDNRSTELNNYILYLIADKTYPGMLSYFRHYGSKVTKIFNNIKEAKDSLIMQIEPCKIVVIDSGTGKFTSMSARKSLMELLSISDDDNRIAIFYTDSVIMSEAKNTAVVEDKDITWHKYRTTADVLATLLQNLKKENYIYDIKDHEDVDKSERLLKFTGATFKHPEAMDLGLPSLDINEIKKEFGDRIDPASEIEGFKVKY